MRKNGFTLVEILGVITLLAMIAVVVLIAVDGSLKSSKDTLSQAQYESIRSAASMWMANNIDKVNDNGYYTLYLSELVFGGYIGSEILDDDKYNDDFLISMSLNDIKIGSEANEFLNEKYDCSDSNKTCIINRSDLEKVGQKVISGDNMSGKTVMLVQNIDLGCRFDSDDNPLDGCVSWTPIGSEATPFSGTLDGRGHVISGMYINSDINSTGLFSTIHTGIIKNLGIENSVLVSSQGNTGSIAGYTLHTRILNCYNKANVYGRKQSAGIVGMVINSTIKNSYNAGKISSNNNQFSAGIVGYSAWDTSVIENCYNYGEINGGYEAGGIVSGNQGKVLNCYNAGIVKGTYNGGIAGQLYLSPVLNNNYNIGIVSGGIVGNIYSAGNSTNNITLTNNYYLQTSADYGVYSESSNEGASPLDFQYMPSVISVINGDNAFVEDVNNINNGYPILSWELNNN